MRSTVQMAPFSGVSSRTSPKRPSAMRQAVSASRMVVLMLSATIRGWAAWGLPSARPSTTSMSTTATGRRCRRAADRRASRATSKYSWLNSPVDSSVRAFEEASASGLTVAASGSSSSSMASRRDETSSSFAVVWRSRLTTTTTARTARTEATAATAPTTIMYTALRSLAASPSVRRPSESSRGEVGELAHQDSQLEVLRGVDGRHTGRLEGGFVLGRDDATDHHGGVHALLPQQAHDLGHQLQVAPRQDRQPDHVDVLVAGDGGDLLGGQADALVDDLEAGVPSGDGDLLGPVGVAVEAGLGDQQPRRPTGPVLQPSGDLAQRLGGSAGGSGDAGGGSVLAEGLAQGLGPLARGPAGVGQGDGGVHDVLVGAAPPGPARRGPA